MYVSVLADFGIVYMYRCLHPGALTRFMPKVIINIPNLQPHSIMYMEVLHTLYMYVCMYMCKVSFWSGQVHGQILLIQRTNQSLI